MLGQDSCDRTAGIGQQERTFETGQPGQEREDRMARHDSIDKKAGTAWQDGHDGKVATGWPEHYGKYRIAGSGQPVQDSWVRKTGTGKPWQDSQDRISGPRKRGMLDWKTGT